jgi:two-component system LytT family response regulator
VLRVLIVDDEHLARQAMRRLLAAHPEVEIVGEAEGVAQALQEIERTQPQMIFLDIELGGGDGFDLLAALDKPPVVVFVTAYAEHAVEAFAVNAVDYLLKPVDKTRLRDTINRAQERVEHAEIVAEQSSRVTDAIAAYESSSRPPYLERIPVRRRDEIIILPISQIASIVAEGELLYLSTLKNERHAITYRLKDLEARLDPARFIRLGRGTLANIDLITKVNVMPGGTHVALLSNGQKLQVSRLQSRIIRERFLRL